MLTIKHFWIPSQLCTNIERRHINFRVVITARTGVARLYVILLCILVGSRISIRHLRFSHVICTWNAHLLSRCTLVRPPLFTRLESNQQRHPFPFEIIFPGKCRTKGAYGTFRTQLEFINGFSPMCRFVAPYRAVLFFFFLRLSPAKPIYLPDEKIYQLLAGYFLYT